MNSTLSFKVFGRSGSCRKTKPVAFYSLEKENKGLVMTFRNLDKLSTNLICGYIYMHNNTVQQTAIRTHDVIRGNDHGLALQIK